MADELLSNYQHIIDSLTLIPGGGGAFEVIINENLMYSKLATERHAEEGEVLLMFKEKVGPEVLVYGT